MAKNHVGQDRLGDAEEGRHEVVELGTALADIGARAVLVDCGQRAVFCAGREFRGGLCGFQRASGHHGVALQRLEFELDARIDGAVAIALQKWGKKGKGKV